MKIIVEFYDENEFSEYLKWKSENTKPIDSIKLQINIEALKLDARTMNCLKNEGILTILDADKLSDRDLLKVPNLGKKSMNCLRTAIVDYKKSISL